MAVMRSAFVPQHSSTPGFRLGPCCTVASVRKRLQASGIERSRRSVLEPDDGGALASEAGDMWVNVLPCTGEESALDGAEQAAPPGVVHVDAAAPWRSEEAARSISQDTTRISVVIVLFVLSRASHDRFYAVSFGFSQ